MDSNGACTSCYPGYQVKDLTCVVVVLELDPNCNLFENGKCTPDNITNYYRIWLRWVVSSLALNVSNSSSSLSLTDKKES